MDFLHTFPNAKLLSFAGNMQLHIKSMQCTLSPQEHGADLRGTSIYQQLRLQVKYTQADSMHLFIPNVEP